MSQAAKSLADSGYTEVMRLMASGNMDSLKSVCLWRTEALARYREAVVDGEPDPKWMEVFNATKNCRY